jgi:hypothetical protein
VVANAPRAEAVIAGSRTNWVSGKGADPAVVQEVEVPVPTDEARALVAYLMSLKADVALLERPLSAAPASATNTLAPVPAGAAATNGVTVSTNLVKP